MKIQDENPREHQSAVTPKVQQEPGTGGTATIADHRPSTIRQRELREAMHNSPRVTQLREKQAMMNSSPRVQQHATLRATMNAHAATNALPVQRKAPKGSFRFQQLATAMGAQHGVDTSGLVATHNSSFPGKLNAEATIQGNNIHFAPGRDTNYNIRHEVAHAIDNTLNGTPKGDRVVNGQKVDTTREKVVDKMARNPVSALPTPSVSVQRKISKDSLHTGNTTPVQRTMSHVKSVIEQYNNMRKHKGGDKLQKYTDIDQVEADFTAGNITRKIYDLIKRAYALPVHGKGPAFDSQGARLEAYDRKNESVKKGEKLLKLLEKNNYDDHHNFMMSVVRKN